LPPLNLLPGKLDWSSWVYGLFAGIIGGGSSAVVSGITVALQDPKDYSLQSGNFYWLVLSVFCANGAMSAFLYLKQSPLPPIVTVTTVKETTAISTPSEAKMVETTVQKTEVQKPETPA
jgi:hypothetical protein